MTQEQAERLVQAVEAIAFVVKTCFLTGIVTLIAVAIFGTVMK